MSERTDDNGRIIDLLCTIADHLDSIDSRVLAIENSVCQRIESMVVPKIINDLRLQYGDPLGVPPKE